MPTSIAHTIPRFLATALALAATLFTATPAHASQQITFAPLTLPDSGRIVIPVAAAATADDDAPLALTGLAARIDARTGGALAAAVAEAAFTGKANSTLTLYGLAPWARIDLVGTGSEPLDRAAAEDFGSTAAKATTKVKGGRIHLLWPQTGTDATAARVAFGWVLGSYRFDRHQAERRAPADLPALEVRTDDSSAATFTGDLAHLADAVTFARDMSSEPGNVIFPESFVARVRAAFADVGGVAIRVLDEQAIQDLGMGAHWGVGRGSARPPRLLVLEYLAGGDGAPVVLAGKGITFDTGGISLKRNADMWQMKGDLGGAGVVVGTVLATARRGAAVNVVAVAALAENMPSGTASRPGDVLTTMSGTTVEIINTDAEGRLVLADAVHYAQATWQPSVLIDVATLTGSVRGALGDDYAGLFGRAAHDDLIADLTAAAATANEPVWRLPLDDGHFEQIKSDVADIKNSGAGRPGASVGAAFIGTFVDAEQAWAHFDIAGVDHLKKGRPTMPKGYTGWGVRTLDEYLRRHHAAR